MGLVEQSTDEKQNNKDESKDEDEEEDERRTETETLLPQRWTMTGTRMPWRVPTFGCIREGVRCIGRGHVASPYRHARVGDKRTSLPRSRQAIRRLLICPVHATRFVSAAMHDEEDGKKNRRYTDTPVLFLWFASRNS